MHRQTLEVEAFPAWAKLNNIEFEGITIAELPGKGYGLTVTAKRSEENAVLLKVPKDLILSSENVWIVAKTNQQLREVLEASGDYGRTARGAILIFLLVQITTGSANQFTQYIQMLPTQVPLPTFWSENDRSALQGTSLEAALEAKLKSLDREFTELQQATSSVVWCQQLWWDADTGSLSFQDWKLVDALYRSRALDLPGTGHAMVPCIDISNHSSGDETVALYDTDADGNGILVLRDGKKLKSGEEVTITYGDEKGACEMLFSYGFLEEGMTSAREIFLDLDIPDDDPLKLAKKAVSKSAPGFRLFDQKSGVSWEGPFVFLICVNLEDGLEFQLLQQLDGERELKILWQDVEMSDLSNFEALLREDPRWPLFELRATVVVRDRVQQQLMILEDKKTSSVPFDNATDKESYTLHLARKLQDLEEWLMLQAYNELEKKIANELFPSDIVQQYLGSGKKDNIEQEDNFA